MTRILVTGASGFVGRAVVTAFAQSDRTIRAAVRRPPEPTFAAGVEVVQHPDLSQSFDWKPYLEGVDQVVHLAGIAHTGGVAPELYDRVNHRATAELAAASAAAGVHHFVFVSSIRAQSGPSADHALTERDAPAPTDAYGRSKLAAEAAVRASGMNPLVHYLRQGAADGQDPSPHFDTSWYLECNPDVRAAGCKFHLPGAG